jgi:hypothetical protein
LFLRTIAVAATRDQAHTDIIEIRCRLANPFVGVTGVSDFTFFGCGTRGSFADAFLAGMSMGTLLVP